MGKHPKYTDEEFMSWMAEAIEHIDHTLVSVRNAIYVLVLIAVVNFFLR